MNPSKPIHLRLKALLPAVAFLGGFLWDALTLGKKVRPFDLASLALYLLGAAVILLGLGRGWWSPQPLESLGPLPKTNSQKIRFWLMHEAPFFILQFCYGGLFSALFIFYFLSSSYLPAYFLTFLLGLLLIANEFLESHYVRFTLSWALFGLCCILLLNFLLPYWLGSIHPIWFYTSTVLGAVLTHLLKAFSPKAQGRIYPVYGLAGFLLIAFLFNLIPPVPLVKRSVYVGLHMTHEENQYSLEIEPTNRWIFWRSQNEVVHLPPGEKLFAFSSIFAPSGLHTEVFHRWQFHDPEQGWITLSRAGYPLLGGRQQGYRGCSYKQSPKPGEWRVLVENENGSLIAVQHFTLEYIAENTEIHRKTLAL